MARTSGQRRSVRRGALVLAVLACCTALVGSSLSVRHDGPPTAAASPGAQPRAEVDQSTAATPATTSAQRATNRPNLLVITVDDMREDDLRFMPHTRRLIGSEGVRFNNAFAPHPLCCPSRSSFLTGQYTHNHKVWSHIDPWGFTALDDAETLPVWLQRDGYRTAFIGKYLNGYGRQPAPDGSSDTSLTYVPPGWSRWQGSLDGGFEAGDPRSGGTYRYFDTTFNHDGAIDPYPGRYSTRVAGDMTQQVLDESAGSPSPFFLWVNYVAPHAGGPAEPDDPQPVVRGDRTFSFPTPARPAKVRGRFDWKVRQAPGASGEADVSDKPYFIRALPPLNRAERLALRAVTRQRAEALSVVDHQVRRTIDTLANAGQLKNTVVMFTSDNGYFLGEHRLRGGKLLPYEPSIAVPLLVRGPGVPRGQVRQDPFISADFAPTLLSAGGVSVQQTLDGADMWGVIRDGDRGWRRGVLTDSGPRGLVGENGENALEVPPTADDNLRFSIGVRAARWLYVRHANGEVELYDMRYDPGQLTNVAGRPWFARVEERLGAELARLRNCEGAECSEPMRADLQG
ncbi:MAG: sulfatase [Nocardioides sp.]|uniref:sulfatase family protein n=1 Tax=Nocardioides sp. TaxID=35761 RepID=UPI003F045C42